jgi:hypothetical protein
MSAAFTEDEKLVMREYLLGTTRDDTARKLKVSTGKVSAIWLIIQSILGDAGEALRELSISLKKSGLSLVDCRDGYEASAALRRLGVKDITGTTRFVESIYKGAIESNSGPKEVLQQALRLTELEAETGRSADAIFETLSSFGERESTLTKTISDLQAKEKEAKDATESALREGNITLEQVKAFDESRQSLQRLGQNVKDVPRLARMMTAAAEQRHDVKRILKFMSKEGSLREEIAELEKRVSNLKGLEEKLDRRTGVLNKEVERKENLLEEAERLEKIGYNLRQLQQLAGVVSRISKKNGLAPDEAARRFFEVIRDEYDSRLGLGRSLEGIKEEVVSLRSEADKQREHLKVLGSEHRDMARAIAVVRSLSARSISEQDIITWQRILSRVGISPVALHKDLQAYSTIEGLLTRRRNEAEKLGAEIQDKGAALGSLKKEQARIASSLETIKENGIARIGEMAGKVTSVEQTILKAVKATEKSLEATVTPLQEATSRAVAELDKTVANTNSLVQTLGSELEVVETIGKYRALMTFYGLLDGGDKALDEVLPVMIAILQKFRARLGKTSLGRQLDEMAGTFEGGLRSAIIPDR